MQQSTIWTNADLIHWRIYAELVVGGGGGGFNPCRAELRKRQFAFVFYHLFPSNDAGSSVIVAHRR